MMLTNFKDSAKRICQFHFDHLVLAMVTSYRVK